jgi:hypothetical protein
LSCPSSFPLWSLSVSFICPPCLSRSVCLCLSCLIRFALFFFVRSLSLNIVCLFLCLSVYLVLLCLVDCQSSLSLLVLSYSDWSCRGLSISVLLSLVLGYRSHLVLYFPSLSGPPLPVLSVCVSLVCVCELCLSLSALPCPSLYGVPFSFILSVTVCLICLCLFVSRVAQSCAYFLFGLFFFVYCLVFVFFFVLSCLVVSCLILSCLVLSFVFCCLVFCCVALCCIVLSCEYRRTKKNETLAEQKEKEEYSR